MGVVLRLMPAPLVSFRAGADRRFSP
jgi:hypothetical protein